MGVALGDHVAFGVVQKGNKAPVAVNVFRIPKKKKKRKAGEMDEANLWDGWKGDFDYTGELPKAVQGELVGVIGRQNARTGHFYIECREVYKVFQRDATIKVHDLPRGLGIGDPITFEIDPPRSEESSAIARNMQKATGPRAEAVLAIPFRERDKPAGFVEREMREGDWRCTRCRDVNWARNLCCKRCGAPKKMTSGEGAGVAGPMRMLGIVKKKSMKTERHFVFCQDISDVYKMDAQIPLDEVPPGLKVGDRIAFDVQEPAGEGRLGCPLCRNVSITGGAADRLKRAADAGEGEDDDDDDEIVQEEKEDEEEVEADDEEPAVDDQEMKAAEKEAKMEAEVQRLAEEDEEEAVIDPSAEVPADPDTLEGWITLQHRLFPGLPKLKPGWIRMRSKSRGLVYYYNVQTGESTSTEPLR